MPRAHRFLNDIITNQNWFKARSRSRSHDDDQVKYSIYETEGSSNKLPSIENSSLSLFCDNVL